MKKRLFVFFVILALVAGLLPVVSAQDKGMGQLNCLNLSKDDCTIVTTSIDNVTKMTSFTPSFSVTENLSGIETLVPGSGMDSSADIKGNGAIVIDKAAMTKDAPYKGVAVSFDITGTTNSKGKDTPVNVSFVLADGVVYWKDSKGAWQGVAIADMIKAFQKGGNMSFMGMPLPASMMSGMMGSMMSGAATSPEATPDAAAAAGAMQIGGTKLQDLLQLPGFLSQKRLDDATMGGQKMAVFAYTGDIGVVLQSPDVQKALGDAMTGIMSAQSGASGSQASGMGAMMAQYMPILLQSTTGTITLTRWIGTDDQFIHQVSFDVNATIDLNGGQTSSKVTPLPPITFKLNVTFTLDKINSTTAPTAPTGATMVTPAQLFPEVTPEATPA